MSCSLMCMHLYQPQCRVTCLSVIFDKLNLQVNYVCNVIAIYITLTFLVERH